MLLGAALLAPSLAHGAELGQVVQVRSQGNAASAQSQQRIDGLSDQTDKALAEYRSVLKQIEALRRYNSQLEELIQSQKAEMASLRNQIDNVTVVGRQVTPLMQDMLEALDAFVAADVPFLPGERRLRVAGLKELMARSDVTDAEKYRRVMEAYQIENEFGRTIEAYSGELEWDDGTRTVDFLRIGRVALLYRTRDGNEIGAWDQANQVWVQLPGAYRSAVRQGLRIARKQAAPDLIEIPVPAAVGANQ
ncbi:MAG: DUF3450 domain-containing protein [Proteobacteria bacterium]|nr:DUF3450 domain-containing protein [Pseudomonadota bacterium]